MAVAFILYITLKGSPDSIGNEVGQPRQGMLETEFVTEGTHLLKKQE